MREADDGIDVSGTTTNLKNALMGCWVPSTNTRMPSGAWGTELRLLAWFTQKDAMKPPICSSQPAIWMPRCSLNHSELLE